jgi:gamma-glutamyltranspeptidase / glutathione hydrolase
MRRNPFLVVLLGTALLAALVGAQGAGAQEPAKLPTARGTGGAAATVDALGTQAAIDTLKAGGNAVDAAVAAAAVLGVTEPFSCGIGGGGFMVIRTPGRTVTTIDGREAAPASMTPRSFFEGDQPLAFNAARFSGLSAGVPGTVDTWDEALRQYGTYSLSEALQPGIRVARDGFTIDQTFFDQTQGNVDFFDDVPSSAALYLDPDGTPRDVGTTLRNPDMARTYERIAKLGAAKGFYGGAVADAMVEASQDPPVSAGANHTWRPGLMTMRDLRAYDAIERAPTRVGYRGLDVYGMGPPSSGGSTVGEALNILEGYSPLGETRAQALHRFIEASRYSFADRNRYLADPAFFDVPLRGLLSDSFAAERRAEITGTAANRAVDPGDPYDNQGDPRVTIRRGSPGPGLGTSTTHLTVADTAGTIVSYTFTIESTGGNGIVVPGWGFLLNNELTDFNFDAPEHPNAPAGGKRPRSSMAPTIVTRAGQPVLATGSPGGSMIITTVLQTLIDRLDLGSTLPQAIAAPRVSQRNGPFSLAEAAFLSSSEGQELRAAPYSHDIRQTGEIGAVTAIEFLSGDRFLSAAEPVRRGGGSAGVVTPE